ncbi:MULTISPECIES: hypothetical protein [unclassified Acinetobacter]|uniref:hypothetical protein n=1 Tax=unclassified Acinetobacter TaxID=196816 RepID=UPI0035B74EEC
MSNLQQDDLKLVVNKFSDEGKDSDHRYRSFDLCYSHFYFSKKNNLGRVDN